MSQTENKSSTYVLMGIGLIAVLAVGAFFFGIKPQLAARAEAKTQTDAAVTATAGLEAQYLTLAAKRDALPQAEADAKEIAAQFPPDFEFAGWVDMIVGAAESSGAEISSIAPATPTQAVPGESTTSGQAVSEQATTEGAATEQAAPVDSSTLAESGLTIEAVGTVEALRKFLIELGRIERPVLVDNFTLSESGSHSTLSVSGKTYLMAPLPGLDATDAAEESLPKSVEGSEN